MPSRPIVGAFVFPDFWENSLRAKSNLARLRDCGVNAIMTESDSYELSALDATHKAGLRFFAGIACFSDHASNFRSLNKRPELWPVLENGERRPQMEWYVGMSPTDRTRQEEALAEIKSIALNYPVDGVFLDFARWPLHWEIELRPGRGRPLNSTFDPATLAKFEEATGALPRGLNSTSARAAWIRENQLGEWLEFKCRVVNDFVGEARNALRETKADAELGLYVVPDVNRLTESLTGQRISDLARLVDWVAPMLYHNILLQPPTWIASARLFCCQGRREKDTAGPAGRFEPRPRGRWRLGTADVELRLERNAFASRRATRDRRAHRFPGNGADGRKGRFAASDARTHAAMTDFANRPDAILRVEHISKSFGAVVALQDATLHLPTGEITGLVGDNGAGKSTLIKIISGVLTPDAGSIEFGGKGVRFASPAEAREHGIETVYQDLALAGNMAVWANVYLGREQTIGPKFLHILDKRAMLSKTGEMLERFIRNVPPIAEPVEMLSGGQRQVVAIARAGAWGSKLILMDEPTAALGVAETKAVEEVIFGLKRQGLTLLVISHNLDQIFRLTDGVWVLRRGRVIGYRKTASTHPDEIVSMITGAAASAGAGA